MDHRIYVILLCRFAAKSCNGVVHRGRNYHPIQPGLQHCSLPALPPTRPHDSGPRTTSTPKLTKLVIESTPAMRCKLAPLSDFRAQPDQQDLCVLAAHYAVLADMTQCASVICGPQSSYAVCGTFRWTSPVKLSSCPAAQSRHHLQIVQTTAEGTDFSRTTNMALSDF